MAHSLESSGQGGRDLRPGMIQRQPGFYGVAQQANRQWTLLDPDGEPFFLRGVHEVRNEAPSADAAVPADASSRLRAWGFNIAGVGGDGAARDDGLPYLALVDFCAATTVLCGPGLRLPDVFDPAWGTRCIAHAAARCGPLADARELVGWVTDDALGWAQPGGNAGPGLLQQCLSMEPACAAYHAAWEFVVALYPSGLDEIGRSWGVPLANREVVREMTRCETPLAGRGYLRDDARWTREFARRYFAATAAAVRAADPNHLLFGCRSRVPAGPVVLREAAYPAADVQLVHWLELPSVGSVPRPLLAGDVCWARSEFRAAADGSRASRAARLTSVERMLRRGRAALRRLARHPAVVGYVWSHWHDEPGEQPPFGSGLVHRGGAEATEHTELLADFNVRADSIRRLAGKDLSP